MIQKNNKPFFTHVLGSIVACVVLFLCTAFAKDKPKDEWQIRENLVTRLSGEWYKLARLDNELQTMQDILQDVRDFELFPADLTGLGEASLLAFDKRIEKIGKKHLAITLEVRDLRAPLADGMAILREMVIGQPIEDMFQVLDNDDVKRISEMFVIKHHIDSLWKDVDGIFTGLMPVAQTELMPQAEMRRGFETEFIEILKANLGQQAEGFYRKLRDIKDTLANRGSDEQGGKMFQVEAHRIRNYLKTNNTEIAKTKIAAIKNRYKGARYSSECSMLFSKICFARGEYDEVLSNTNQLSDSIARLPEMILLKIQSEYLLKKYTDVWNWAYTYDFKQLLGSSRNLALWLAMESGLALGKSEKYSEFALSAVKDSSYSLHILHALGRFYIQSSDWTTAQSVFESALRSAAQNSSDTKAASRIALSLAQLHFERKNYAKSLRMFFDLLNHEESFTEALYGISWCYIALGNFPKAELSLRKLINQNPESPLAVEGLLVTAKKYGAQAKSEWEKLTFVTSEERRLVQKLEIIQEKKAGDTLGSHALDYTKLSSKIQELLRSIKSEDRASASDIAGYYDKAISVTHLISGYYETGTFQEIEFSEKREKLMGELDSLIMLTKSTGGAVSVRKTAQIQASRKSEQIKKLVMKSSVLTTNLHIDRFKWQREFIDWQKTALKNSRDNIDRKIRLSGDSAFIAICVLQKKALTVSMDSLVKAGDELEKIKFVVLSKSCMELMNKPIDEADRAYIRYHLGEILYAHENENFAADYSVYENKMAVFDSLYALYRDGKSLELPIKPHEPVLRHEKSIEQFRRVIADYSGSEVVQAAQYSLAWCYNDQGQFDSAVAAMTIVAEKYPSSQYAPQAWLYLGEYLFDHGKLDKALVAYQAVIKYPESEWFDKALYKLAWTQYRLSNPEKAISSFLALVDLGQGSPSGKSLLEKESIDYIAISFSETDVNGEKGLERATNFVKRFGDESKGALILQRMATIFREQGRFDMAQKTFRTLLRIYPEYKNSPAIESDLLAVMEKSSTVEEANIARIEYFNKYNKNGVWASLQKDAKTKQQGDSIASKQLYDASISSHQRALQKNDSLAYTSAIENYEMFLKNYPSSPSAGECNYNLAEIMFSLGNYIRAAEEYITVSKRYSNTKYKETASWNAIVASQNLLKKESPVLR